MIISAGPNITEAGASLSSTGYLIPQVDIGSSTLGGITSSTICLNPGRVCEQRFRGRRAGVRGREHGAGRELRRRGPIL